ncbi:hypothetical protein D3C84_955050 [compost metagenome]
MGAEVNEGNLRLFAVGDASTRVKRDCIPHEFSFRLRITVLKQEAASGICAVDFKALVGREFVCQSQIV